MGLALLIVVLKTLAAHRSDERYNDVGALLGQDLRDQLHARRRDRHPDGISVRHQLGAVLAGDRRGHRAAARRWKACSRSFSSRRFWVSSSSARRGSGAGRTGGSAFAVFLGSWLSGFFIIVTDAWMQHPVALRAAAGRRVRRHELLGAAAEPLGARPVRAHHVRRGHHRRVRDGGRRRVTISSPATCADHGAHLPARRRRRRRAWRRIAPDFSQRRSARRVTWRRTSRSTTAAMEGLFKTEAGAPHRDPRPAGHASTSGSTTRSSSTRLLSFLIYGTTDGRGAKVSTRFRATSGRPTSRSCSSAITSWLAWARCFVAVMAAAALLLWRGGSLTAAGCSGS